MDTVITSIRTDAQLEHEADRLFADLGMNFSTAVNTFLRQAVRERGLPFCPHVTCPYSSVTRNRQQAWLGDYAHRNAVCAIGGLRAMANWPFSKDYAQRKPLCVVRHRHDLLARTLGGESRLRPRPFLVIPWVASSLG